VVCRPASGDEAAACTEALGRWRALEPAVDATAPEPARVHVVWAILNHTDFVTLR
jgi:hypothetical protein